MAAPAHSPTQPPTAYNRWEAGWESGPVPPPKSLFRDFPKTGLSAVRAGPALPRMPAGYARNRNSAFERSGGRSEEHTSELQSLMRISYAVFCLKTKTYNKPQYDDDVLFTNY